jgi:hypothetical protein
MQIVWIIIVIGWISYFIPNKYPGAKYKKTADIEIDTIGDIVSCNSNTDCIKMLSLTVQDSYNKNKSTIIEYMGGKTSLLIYRYAKNMCNTCIVEDLEELSCFQKKAGSEHVCILPAYGTDKYDNVILTNELHNFEFKNIPLDVMAVPLDSNMIMRRYFGYVDNKGNLSMVFFPTKDHVNQTRSYLSEINKKIEQGF